MKWKPEWLGCLLYAIAAACFIANGPGFEYDEALLAHGAVHVLHGHGSPPYAHDFASWFCVGNFWLPLMVISYVGAVKDYLLIPLFATFGVSAAVGRAASALMTLVLVWAGGRLLRRRAGSLAAIAFGCSLAIQPTFVAATTFDNGSVANWMFPLGLFILAADELAEFPDRKHAFWLGAAAGFAIWCRANCVWFLAAIAMGVVVVYRHELRQYARLALPASIGAVAGALPFLIFQIASSGAIFKFLGARQNAPPLPIRVRALAGVLVSSAEERAIWGGVAPPRWETIAIAIVVAMATILALLARERFHRAAAIATVVVTAIMVLTHAPVAEHHLVGLVPFFAAVTALAFVTGPRWRRIVGLGAAAIYLFIAISEIGSAIRALRSTGGVGVWSDAIDTIARDPAVAASEIGIVDWGLYNNLYVLTRARIRARELFWASTETYAGDGTSWDAQIARGGTYLVPAAQTFPKARIGFTRALNASGQRYTVRTFLQRNGWAYADLYRVAPAGANLGNLQPPTGHRR